MISAFIGKDVLEFSTDRTKTGAIHSGFRLLKDKPGSDVSAAPSLITLNP